MDQEQSGEGLTRDELKKRLHEFVMVDSGLSKPGPDEPPRREPVPYPDDEEFEY